MNIKVPWRIDWTEQLSVGIPEIDAEHQRFIGLVNDFNKALRERAEISRLKSMLVDIIQDARSHFAHEEQLFAEFHYKDIEEHARTHEDLIKTLEQQFARLRENSLESEWIQIGMDIRDMLVAHLLEDDMKFRGMDKR